MHEAFTAGFTHVAVAIPKLPNADYFQQELRAGVLPAFFFLFNEMTRTIDLSNATYSNSSHGESERYSYVQ